MLVFNRYSSILISKMSKKINYPSANRNKDVILEVLQKHFAKNVNGTVLEISSGTGQHMAHFAPQFPKLLFQPSEYDTSLFSSIKAYVTDVPTKNMKDPIFIDIVEDWTKWKISSKFDYAININMIHVAPFICSERLFKNIAHILKPGGLLITYGPYANNGVLEPQSNRDFDRQIRNQNPNFGVRDIQDLIKLSETYNITLAYIYEMPANNKCIVWQNAF